MDPEQDLEPDLYRDPDRNSRPVPLPRVRSNPGPDSEELHGRQLFNKWRSLEQKPDPEPGLRPRPKSGSWTKPGLKDFRHTNIRSTEETLSDQGPEPESLKKDSSLHRNIDFRGPQTRSDQGPEPESLKKDSSLHRNIDFRGPQTRSDQGPEPESLKKDSSLHRNIDFRGPQTRLPGDSPYLQGTSQRHLRDQRRLDSPTSLQAGLGPAPIPAPRPRHHNPGSQTSPEPSLDSQPQSLRSDLDFRRSGPELESFPKGGSKHHHVDFRGLPQTRLEPNWRSHLDPIFQKLEVQMVEFVKQQLQRFHKLLTSESTSESALESASGEHDSELVLNLTVDFLKRLDQEPLADLLQTKSSGSICRGKLKSRLQQRFSQVFEGVAKAGSPAPLNQIYTELYITEGGATEDNLEHEVRHIESVSRKPATPETAITCENIFKPRPSNRKGPITAEQTERPIRTVLTKGVAGVGKTVLTQKFSLDWAEGRANQDIQLVFPFTFRELNVLQDTEYSLEGLLHHFFSQTKGLCSFQQLQVLFIFDGLDECRLPLDFTKTKALTDPTERASVEELLVNLIRGNLLPSAHLWITTRPAAANQIPAECVSMVTEVRGFTDPQKEQYFRKRFRDEQQATAVIAHIKKSRVLYSMCYIPVFGWILSVVLQKVLEQAEKPELPQTLTEMYVHFLVVQAKVKNIKFHQGTGADLHWTPETREMVHSLGKLAFEQLQKGNLIFYESDLSECGLDAAEIARYSGVFTQVFREEPGLYQDKVYCFIHLSVQEFLAALHVHQTFFSSGENLLVDDDVYWARSEGPTQFYKSAVEMCVRRPNGQLDLFLRFLLGLSLPANQSLLRGLMSQTGSERTNQETVQYVQTKVSEELSTDRVLNLFHCLNELQDCSLEQQMQSLLRSGVLDPSRLIPGQWAALVFLLLSSDRDLELFDLRNFCPSENALLRLLPVLKASSKATLSGCNLTSQCCADLGSVLAGSGLKELDLSNNNLQDSGVEQLCEGLKSATCGLQTLRLSICNLTSQCCSALGSVLVESGLKELDLSDNDLQDFGVELLCKGLKSATCGLQTLRLSGCLLTQRGCSSLATALRASPTHLLELDMSYNSLGPSGVQLMTALRDDHNNRLTTLRLDFSEQWWKIRGLAKYFCELELDLTTANSELKVLKDNRTVMFKEEPQDYPQHPQRFDWYPQILCSLKDLEPDSKTGLRAQSSPYLSGRSYWEVDWSGGVAIAVTDSKIRRRGDQRSCVFGWNDHSWRLWCSEGRYAVCHDSKQQVLSAVPHGANGRVGVFLDPSSGTLSFYEVQSDSQGRDHRTHLHTFHARFPQNLLPGIGFGLRSYNSTAFLCGVYFEVVN